MAIGDVDDLLLRRVLYGISCRNYEAAAEVIPGAIGLSSSTVSRGFIQASAAQLRAFQERDLSGEDVVAVFLDGKTFADATMVIALGITLTGEKRFLGFVETDTENATVLTPFGVGARLETHPQVCHAQGSSRTNAVRLRLAKLRHPIENVARQEGLGLSSARCPSSQATSNDRLVSEEGVFCTGLLMVTRHLLPLAPAERLHLVDRPIPSVRSRSAPRHPGGLRRGHHDGRAPRLSRIVDGDGVVGGVRGDAGKITGDHV